MHKNQILWKKYRQSRSGKQTSNEATLLPPKRIADASVRSVLVGCVVRSVVHCVVVHCVLVSLLGNIGSHVQRGKP